MEILLRSLSNNVNAVVRSPRHIVCSLPIGIIVYFTLDKILLSIFTTSLPRIHTDMITINTYTFFIIPYVLKKTRS